MAAVTVVSVDGKPQPRPDRRWYQERPKVAYEDMDAGTPVYVRSDGKVAKARSNAAGTANCLGLTATAVKAGATVTVVMRGSMTGWSGLTPGTFLYVSSGTAGVLDDTQPAAIGGTDLVPPVAYVMTASTIELLCPAVLGVGYVQV